MQSEAVSIECDGRFWAGSVGDSSWTGGFRSGALGVAAALLCLVQAGCVVSLHPLYEPSDLVSDPRLEGRWVDDEGAEWTFVAQPGEGGVGHYQVIYRSDRQAPRTTARQPISVDAHLLKLGEQRYLNLTVDPRADEHSLYDLHLLPVHSFWRIGVEDDTLTLQSLDVRALEAAAQAGTVAAETVEVRNWRVLTANTKALQALLSSLEAEGKGFDEPAVLERIPTLTP